MFVRRHNEGSAMGLFHHYYISSSPDSMLVLGLDHSIEPVSAIRGLITAHYDFESDRSRQMMMQDYVRAK